MKYLMIIAMLFLTGCASAASVNDLAARQTLLEAKTQNNFTNVEKAFNSLAGTTGALTKKVEKLEGAGLDTGAVAFEEIKEEEKKK